MDKSVTWKNAWHHSNATCRWLSDVAQPQLYLVVTKKRPIDGVSVALTRVQTASPSKVTEKPPIGSVSVTLGPRIQIKSAPLKAEDVIAMQDKPCLIIELYMYASDTYMQLS